MKSRLGGHHAEMERFKRELQRDIDKSLMPRDTRVSETNYTDRFNEIMRNQPGRSALNSLRGQGPSLG